MSLHSDSRRTMRSFVLISALLLCSWVSVSGSESQAVQVQPGEDITLLCPNISTSPTHIFWSRFTTRTRISCISSMYQAEGSPSYCDPYVPNGKYEMSSNVSTVFLKIKQADSSDSGLYLCGFYINGHTIIHVKDVTVQGSDESNSDSGGTSQSEPNTEIELMSVILAAAAVTVILIMTIIALAVKYRKLQTAHKEQSQQNQNLRSEDLNYAALSFHPKTNRSRRPASDRQLEPNVVYAATR